MADDRRPGVPQPDDSGVQRALGERRRRRLAERSGQVDLDATMSHWPVVEPPTAPRPVVRPARPTVDGAATEPVLPPPGQIVVGPLLEARRAGADPDGGSSGGRRSRRRAAAGSTGGPDGTATGSSGAAARTGAATVVPGRSTGPVRQGGPDPGWAAGAGGSGGPAGAAGAGGVGGAGRPRDGAPTPAPTPTPVGPGPRDALGSSVLGGRRGAPVWPPTPRRLVVVAVVVGLLVLLGVLLSTLLDDGDAAAVAPDVDGAAAQQTLAMGLVGPDGSVATAALLGVDPEGLSTLLLPGDLLLTVADAGPLTVGQAAVLGPDAVDRGLEDSLLLRVDSAVLLQGSQLAALVDAVGGVVVDVTAQVVGDEVVVPAGDGQRLTGAQAVAYATLQVDGEPVEAALARYGDVLVALLAALPTDAADVGEALAGADVTGTGTPDGLAAALAGAADHAAAGRTQAVVLPTAQRASADADRRGLTDESDQVLTSRFAGAALPVAAVGEVRVVVRNGVGSEGLVARARDLLVGAGLRYAGGGNAASFGQADSAVLVASQDQDDRAEGEAVARALGLDGGALQVTSEAMVDTDVVVVLGQDFAAATADTPTQAPPTPGDLP